MPDTSTEVAIATTTLGSAASTITFSSIPNTYTDLKIILVAKSNATGSGSLFELQANGDTGANYSTTRLYGNGATVTSTRATGSSSMCRLYAEINTTQPSFCEFDIFSYAGSTNKTALGRGAFDLNGSGAVSRAVGLWRNTAAITSVTILSANMDTGTTATLYGIL